MFVSRASPVSPWHVLLRRRVIGVETQRSSGLRRRRAAASAPADPFPGLKFRNIGPATMGGRVDDLAVLESNPAVFYVGTATGGLWKTVNNGTTWDVLFDDLDDVVSIGDIAIAPNDANTVWVGTGENNNRQSGSWGNGVYKSTDGGETWKHMGLRDSKHIARIIVDPIDHDVVYVAALGSLWGRGEERGVFKTTDGGLTWTQRARSSTRTPAPPSWCMDPSNNKVLYAATYQRRRATWGFNGGGPGSAMWKSSDAGRTWTKLTNGVPTGPARPHRHGRLPRQPEHRLRAHRARDGERHLSLGRRRPDVAEDVEHQSAADVLQPDPHRSRPTTCASTCSACRFTSPTTAARRSSRTARCTRIITRCGSTRRTRITSSTATTAASASAGTRARRGKAIYNMDLGQFYHVSYDMETPYNLCGGMQDNYTWCGPSAVRSRNGIVNDDWFQIQGGDGFEALIDPKNSRIIYAESQDGNIVARRPGHQRAQDDPPAAGARRSAATLELEHADPDLAARSGDDLRRRQQGLQVDRSRPVVDGDQPRPDAERPIAKTLSLMGVSRQGLHHRQERRRAVLRQPRAAGRIAEASRRALRRRRRRQGAHDARTAARPGPTSPAGSRACRRTPTCRACRRRRTTSTPSMRRSTTT